MIIVLAGVRDADVAGLAGELGAPTGILTPAELAMTRSCLHDPGFNRSTLTIEGREVRVGAIAGIVNLLPAVLPEALTMYDPPEREYQAAELHAWLLFFLSALRCRVVNRPTTLSLTGPVLNQLGWFGLARAAGVPVDRVTVSSASRAAAASTRDPELVEVVCLGGAVVSPSGTEADRHTMRLAEHARVEYLRARFVRDPRRRLRLAGASPLPRAGDRAERAAIAAYFAT